MPVEGSPEGESGGINFGGERLPRRKRIRHGEEIRHLLRQGLRRRTPSLDVFVSPVSAGDSRFGTIVPKHRRTIVERNRLRRRLREIGRRDVLPALRACGRKGDVLVRTRPQAYDVDFATLRRELLGITEALCSESSPLA
jgi:ribonuclease P protein component